LEHIMRYAQTGITSYVPPEGACRGHRFEDRPDQDDPHMSVDCAACEPHLAADPLWASAPSEVPLTVLEQRQADAAKATFDQVAAQSVAGLAALLAGGGLTNLAALAQSGALQVPPAAAAAVAAAPAAPAAPAPAAPAAAKGPARAPAKGSARQTRTRKPAGTSA
jgi:hypothetical protein